MNDICISAVIRCHKHLDADCDMNSILLMDSVLKFHSVRKETRKNKTMANGFILAFELGDRK